MDSSGASPGWTSGAAAASVCPSLERWPETVPQEGSLHSRGHVHLQKAGAPAQRQTGEKQTFQPTRLPGPGSHAREGRWKPPRHQSIRSNKSLFRGRLVPRQQVPATSPRDRPVRDCAVTPRVSQNLRPRSSTDRVLHPRLAPSNHNSLNPQATISPEDPFASGSLPTAP